MTLTPERLKELRQDAIRDLDNFQLAEAIELLDAAEKMNDIDPIARDVFTACDEDDVLPPLLAIRIDSLRNKIFEWDRKA